MFALVILVALTAKKTGEKFFAENSAFISPNRISVTDGGTTPPPPYGLP